MTEHPSEADLAPALQLAVERHELSLLYQPKIALNGGHLVGVEALMRWQSAEWGKLMPALFIPAAERHGVIDAISTWGLRTALDDWAGWRDQGVSTNVAFNISPLTLRDPEFPGFLQRLCMQAGARCDQLTIEVTEGERQHLVRMLEAITRLRIKGMAVELDDFGTGYSSLMLLRHLPYSGLKIDACFVRDLAVEPEARLIVRAMIDLAHGLGMTATAEGIEDEATLDVLRDLGCDHAQGFLIARPMCPSELVPWVLGPGRAWRTSLVQSELVEEQCAAA